jgi:hypothetical protein
METWNREQLYKEIWDEPVTTGPPDVSNSELEISLLAPGCATLVDSGSKNDCPSAWAL